MQFNKGAFGDMSDEEYSYWHVWNPRNGGEFTLCGNAFEGDGNPENDRGQPFVTKQGRITCPACIELIKFCKSIKNRDIMPPA